MKGTAGVQGALWGTRAREWAELQEGAVRPLYERVLGTVGIGAGKKLLDAGCGAGMFCALAAEQGAEVSGLDASEGLLAVARERVPEGDFQLGEIEEPPYESQSFDVVTGFNSFQFAADPQNALRQAGRVVRSEGSVVVAIWGPVEECQAAVTLKAIGALLPPPPAGAPGPFALSEPGALDRFVQSAGLVSQETHDVPCPWVYPDLDTAVRGLGSSGPANRAREEVGGEAVDQALAESLQPYLDVATGIVRLENVFRFVVTTPR